MKKLSILLSTLIIFSACEKIIEPKDLPDQDPRLVLNAIVENDSVFTASLSSSKSIISGKEYKSIDKSYCAVYEDGKFLEQLTFNSKGKYTGTKKPVAGKFYEFVARASGFTDVNAKSDLPVLPELVSALAYDTVLSVFSASAPKGKPFESVFGGMKFKVSLKERSGVADYFELTPILVLVDSFGMPLDILPPLLAQGGTDSGSGSSFYTSTGVGGSDADGVVAGLKTFDTYLFCNATISDPDAAGIHIYMIASRLSEAYYKYLQTSYQQANTSGSFFAEPTFVYSNCSNGMGIVGGRSSKLYFIKSVLFKR